MLAPVDAANRQLMDNLTVYHFAELQRINRGLLAREAGLAPGEFARPFPGTTINITNPTPVEPPVQATPISPVAPPTAAVATADKFIVIREVQGPDGVWREVGRSPYRPGDPL